MFDMLHEHWDWIENICVAMFREACVSQLVFEALGEGKEYMPDLQRRDPND